MKGSKGMQLVTKGPPPRSGKRAFVELIPYIVRGAKLHSKGGARHPVSVPLTSLSCPFDVPWNTL